MELYLCTLKNIERRNLSFFLPFFLRNDAYAMCIHNVTHSDICQTVKSAWTCITFVRNSRVCTKVTAMRTNEIASRSSRHLACYSRLAAALLAFLFTSGRGGNNCFRRIVQRDRFSYRRFSLSVRRRRQRFVGYLWREPYVGRYTRCILMHTQGPTGDIQHFLISHAETVIPRGNTALLSVKISFGV